MPPQQGQGRNQYKPNPPIEHVGYWMGIYFFQNRSLKESFELYVTDHLDTEKYGLGMTKYKEMRNQLGYLGVRQQGHTARSIQSNMEKLRKAYPNAGSKEMISLYLQEYHQKVSRSTMTAFFQLYEPELLMSRKRREGLKRKQFWSAGVNALWCVDQHDKWKYKFGLCMHICVDPFSGYIVWLRIWWNNSNPVLIAHYYLESLESLGAGPLITQSDPGTENTRLAQATTFLRHWHDNTLPEASIQHKFKIGHGNVKAEIEWSQVRRRWSPGFENTLQFGVDEGLYDMLNPLHILVFRWIFIPWLQQELDAYRQRVNTLKKRKNKFKLTPHGRPVDIHFRAADFGARDYGVKLDPMAVSKAREIYVPHGHAVLDLVPASFNMVIQDVFNRLQPLSLSRDTVWDVYKVLLHEMSLLYQRHQILPHILDEWLGVVKRPEEEMTADKADVQEMEGLLAGAEQIHMGEGEKDLDLFMFLQDRIDNNTAVELTDISDDEHEVEDMLID